MQLLRKVGARNGVRTERGQMRSFLLAVDERQAVSPGKGNQPGQGDLGGISSAAEHRLAKYHAPEIDAVKAPGEFTIDPGFDAVGQASVVQLGIGLNHGGQYPGARLPGTG